MKRVFTEYYVNRDKKTVVCTITTFDDFQTRLWKYGLLDFGGYEPEKMVFKGIAKCHPEDQFDENLGKKIAEYRASKARKAYVNTRLREFTNKTLINLRKLRAYGFMREPHNPIPEARDKQV